MPDAVKLLINQTSIDINVQDSYGFTPIYEASHWGYIEIIKILAKAGADPNIATIDGSTPIHTASLWGYTDTVKVNRIIFTSLVSQRILFLSGFSRTWSRFRQEGRL